MNMNTGTLYDAVGGAPCIAAVVDELYERLQSDPVVRHHFTPERLPSIKDGQRRWFASVLGGAEVTPPDLAQAHAELQITDEQVAAVMGHLEQSLHDSGVDATTTRRVLAVVGRLWYARNF